MTGQQSMRGADVQESIESPFGSIGIRVTTRALCILRKEDSEAAGELTRSELISKNYELIAGIATMKFEAGETDDDGSVRISGSDLEI